jgi:sporulation protein YlmC with PRC-barrel domain
VVLVDSDEVLEDINPDRYSTMINSDVVTENQDPLGRVRGFKFNIESGEVQALVIASIGLPLIPDTVVSTYELPVEEIASTGPSRIVVFEGAEERLVKITEGFIEKLGIGIPEWEQETEGFYAPPTPAENQLGTGEPLRTPMQRESRRTTRPVMESAWDDDRWNEPELEPIPRSRPMEQRRYYEADMEQENWNEGSSRDRYYNQPGYGRESGNRPPYNQLGYEGNGRSEYDQSYDQSTYGQRDYGQRDHDQSRPNTTGYGQPYDRDNEDVWADSEAKPHQAPLNIPEKRKQPEYEE